jgi:hypothetical protein
MKETADTRIKIGLNEGLRAIGRLIVPSKGTGPLADATPKRSGKLARSTFGMISGDLNDPALFIGQPARTPEEYGGQFYGPFVREGTQPHDIRPRANLAPVGVKRKHFVIGGVKALHFFIGDREVFATVVHHPGTKANPYHKQVMSRLAPAIQDVVNKMGQKVTAYLSGR